MSGSNLGNMRFDFVIGHTYTHVSHSQDILWEVAEISHDVPRGLLDILADLSFQALASLLQLLDGAVLRELVGRTVHLTVRQAAGEQLLQIHVSNKKKT